MLITAVLIGISGWAIARLWTREFIAEAAKDRVYAHLNGKGHPKLAYMIQCSFCFGAWSTIATWAATWVAIGLAVPGLTLGAAVGLMWLLTIIENGLEKDE